MASKLMKSNTSVSEEINNDKFAAELNKKKEQLLGSVTTPKISKSIIRQNRGQNYLLEKKNESESDKISNISSKKPELSYSSSLSNMSFKNQIKVSKKALNTIRDIEKSSPLKGSYFKPKLNEKINTNLQMSNSEFKSNRKIFLYFFLNKLF